jgi:hypothetical protein
MGKGKFAGAGAPACVPQVAAACVRRKMSGRASKYHSSASAVTRHF